MTCAFRGGFAFFLLTLCRTLDLRFFRRATVNITRVKLLDDRDHRCRAVDRCCLRRGRR